VEHYDLVSKAGKLAAHPFLTNKNRADNLIVRHTHFQDGFSLKAEWWLIENQPRTAKIGSVRLVDVEGESPVKKNVFADNQIGISRAVAENRVHLMISEVLKYLTDEAQISNWRQGLNRIQDLKANVLFAKLPFVSLDQGRDYVDSYI
jgi:hypothetical protein